MWSQQLFASASLNIDTRSVLLSHISHHEGKSCQAAGLPLSSQTAQSTARAAAGRCCKQDCRYGYLSRTLCPRKLKHILTRGAELLPSHGDCSPVGRVLARDTTPLQSGKRPLDQASTSDSSPAKRARLTRTDIHRGRYPAIPTRGVKKYVDVRATGSPRRSARLKTRQHPAGGEGRTHLVQSAPPREPPQAEAGTGGGSLQSKRPQPRSNTKQFGVQNKEVAEVWSTFAHAKSTANGTYRLCSSPNLASVHPPRLSKPGPRNRSESPQLHCCENERSTAATTTNTSQSRRD